MAKDVVTALDNEISRRRMHTAMQGTRHQNGAQWGYEIVFYRGTEREKVFKSTMVYNKLAEAKKDTSTQAYIWLCTQPTVFLPPGAASFGAYIPVNVTPNTSALPSASTFSASNPLTATNIAKSADITSSHENAPVETCIENNTSPQTTSRSSAIPLSSSREAATDSQNLKAEYEAYLAEIGEEQTDDDDSHGDEDKEADIENLPHGLRYRILRSTYPGN